jgi:hypothetical protein
VVDTSAGLQVLDNADFRRRVSQAIDEFIATQRPWLTQTNENLVPLADALSTMLSGGKRLRPAFAYWGWRAIGGPDSDEIIRAASALEFVQVISNSNHFIAIQHGTVRQRSLELAPRFCSVIYVLHGLTKFFTSLACLMCSYIAEKSSSTSCEPN